MVSVSYTYIIKTLRKKLNLSQEQLARMLNVSFSTINRWENGKSQPSQMARELINQLCIREKINMDSIGKGE